MTFAPREKIVHDEDNECCGRHCYSCGVDHYYLAVQWCIECGHGYRRRRDLLKAYRAEVRICGFWYWLSVFVRTLKPGYAKSIPFCPLCLHDF